MSNDEAEEWINVLGGRLFEVGQRVDRLHRQLERLAKATIAAFWLGGFGLLSVSANDIRAPWMWLIGGMFVAPFAGAIYHKLIRRYDPPLVPPDCLGLIARAK